MISPAPEGLVRCPFCASTQVAMGERTLRVAKLVKFYVTCDVCWARGPACFDRTEAHAAWNERMYGDVNTPQPWMTEGRDGGPQVAEWAARKNAEKESGAEL